MEHAVIARELDETGKTVRTYVQSFSKSKDQQGEQNERIDVILPVRGNDTKSYAKALLDAFLPVGFPDSVTDDYLGYQIYDSLQAFSSSIASLLSSRAVLSSVGVGDANAKPQDALLLSITQETLGRVATILFAHRFGTAIEPECKMYRLLADIFNDVAMILDCLSPAFPASMRIGVLAGSSVLRALTGVCAGSAKGCLSAHFAKAGNLGELNAKDSSQETVISLAGMLVGTAVVSYITTPLATWSALMLLIVIHLAMNHAAVRAVCMRSLNRQRCNILFSTLLDTGVILTPMQVSKRERIFERGGLLRWTDDRKVGYCRMESFGELMSQRKAQTGSLQSSTVELSQLLSIFEQENYILWFDMGKSKTTVVLKGGAGSIDQIKAWVHALLIAERCQRMDLNNNNNGTVLLDIIDRTCLAVCRLFEEHLDGVARAGWDLNVAALETSPGYRVVTGDETDM